MINDISLNVSSLSIGWSDGIAQTSILQDSSSENLKAVAASGALCQLDLSVQTLSISSGKEVA